MTDIALLGMTALVALLAFVAGHGAARRSSSVRLVDKWPQAHIQFDSDMSQEDVLRFLDMTREMVLTGELAKPKPGKSILRDDEQSRRDFYSRCVDESKESRQ
ncbi:hypothetical protein N7414_30040 [Pseudomonas sp. GD04087]|uniref:hypothetical protein n=1 Tax=unclassified Pseudomonas TaxID=196821 RepID=UPI00244C9749|nr:MULTISPECIES: hypothetical protein [unclassified Pseudomonas]MDH0293381.1 hypothetical protein [Pseudomonas sp. GD04087]MDH1053024.1 hypothetical protein [Pseudomonas sp. GD03903]MDH2003586.1 hypothetical protein [Pseudomonas sp. GD03691]